MTKFASGKYLVKNPDKYMGHKTPTYRSGWEFTFMKFCDENPNILKWANESIRIPYLNPFTNKHTIYVPDFFINYIDSKGKQHTELIEVKPRNQTVREAAKSTRDQAYWALNQIKWEAARAWCRQHGIYFRIINENDIFHMGGKKKR